jgi:IMP dehydrogenase
MTNDNNSDYSQIYLVPREMSQIKSRDDVKVISGFHNLYPIFSSPMKGISGEELVIAMGKNNCLGILHNFMTPLERVMSIHNIAKEKIHFGVAIGINDWETERDVATCAFENGCELICVNIANGYLNRLEEVGKKLRKYFGNEISLMTGNVITATGANELKNYGFDFIRCSIGSGACCTTRLVTGVGRNALAAVEECSRMGVNIVADGGIRYSGDMVKAFAAGADFVMLGTLLAFAHEAENKDEKIYGMASQQLHTVMEKQVKSIEGKEIEIDPKDKMPLKDLIDLIIGGIQSACTYLNSKSYVSLQAHCDIVPVNEEWWKRHNANYR